MINQKEFFIKKSIKYGVIAKFIAVFIQLGLIPLAIGRIGIESFSIYSILIAFFSSSKIICSIVTDNSLTLNLIEARNNNDYELQKKVFSTSFFTAFFLATFLMIIFIFIFLSNNLQWIFDGQLLENNEFIYAYFASIVLLIFFDICLKPFDAVLSAFQLIYLSNKFLIINNILKIIFIFIFLIYPSITFFIVCNFLPLLISTIIPALFFLKRYKYMMPNIKYFCFGALKILVKRGVLLSLTKISTYIYFSLPIIIASNKLTLLDVGYISGMFAIINFLGSILTILTRTLLPSLKDTKNENEYIWRNKIILKFSKIIIFSILTTALLLFIFGNQFLSFYLRNNVELNNLVILGWALIYALSNWEHFTYTILLSINKDKQAIFLYFVGSIFTLLMIYYFNSSLNVILLCLCSGPLFFTTIPYILIIKDSLKIKNYYFK